jgi:hypothetical protein
MSDIIKWGVTDHQLLDFEAKVDERKYELLEGVTIGQMGLINPHRLEAKEAFLFLLAELEDMLPIALKQRLMDNSGLSFSLYFAQILSWWLPQHQQMYLLKAFALLSQKHQVSIQLRWNLARKHPQWILQRRDAFTLFKMLTVALLISIGFDYLGLSLPIWLTTLSFTALFYRFIPKIYQCPDPDCAMHFTDQKAQCTHCGLRLQSVSPTASDH